MRKNIYYSCSSTPLIKRNTTLLPRHARYQKYYIRFVLFAVLIWIVLIWYTQFYHPIILSDKFSYTHSTSTSAASTPSIITLPHKRRSSILPSPNYIPTLYKASVTIQSIQVVNLVFRPGKWNTVLDILTSSYALSQLHIERNLAVYGVQVDLMAFHSKGKITSHAYRSLISPRKVGGHYMTAGGLGCLLSHLHIWKLAVERNVTLMVVEDDIMLHSDFDATLKRILVDLPSDFGLFYFSDLVDSTKSRNSEMELQKRSSLVRLIHGEHWGTFAYLISPTAAAILVDNVYPLHYQVDSYLIATCQAFNISVYRSKENLVFTDNTPGRTSDVQELIRSDSHIKFVPMRFHVLDIYPLSIHRQQLLTRLKHVQRTTTLDIQEWSKKELDHSFEEISMRMDVTSKVYGVQVLRLVVTVLNTHGGMTLRGNFRPKHAVGKIMHDLNGFIAYEVHPDGTFTYPIIGAAADQPVSGLIVTCLDTVLLTATMVDLENDKQFREVWGRAHACLADHTRRFPSPGSFLMFPATILQETGYSSELGV